MFNNIRGKIALVTGGGSGLGLMITKALVQNGCTVYIASRKLGQISKVAQELSSKYDGKCIAIEASLGTKQQALDLALKLQNLEPSGKLDILVNNSGMSWGGSLENFEESGGWDRLFSLNVKTVFYLTTSLLPMLEKGSKGNVDPSRVINISSVAGSINIAESPLSKDGHGTWSYNASKAAVNSLTRTLATSLAPRGITVNAISPGFFPSKMTAFGIKNNKNVLESLQPLGRIGVEEDMQGLILYLSSKASAHMTGVILPLDGGQSLVQTRSNL